MEPNGAVRALIRDRARLLGYIWSIVRDHHVADDLFQDVTVLAIERAAEIKDEGHLLLWARKAARYKALETLRSKALRMILLDEDVLDMLEANWEAKDCLSINDEADHLRDCVEQLTPRAKQIVHLRYTEGLTGTQVAEIVKLKVGSVYVSLARIYRALAECIRLRRVKAESTHA
jgi:RNA polymerase sigma-70 factor (ECF subfamily)